MGKMIKTPKATDVLGVAASDAKRGDAVILVSEKRWHHKWYDYITPLLGIKWGAEITLIVYGYMNHSPGLQTAAVIVAVYLFLEWCQMAWCEFERRAQV